MQTTDRELPGLQPCHANGLVPENLLYNHSLFERSPHFSVLYIPFRETTPIFSKGCCRYPTKCKRPQRKTCDKPERDFIEHAITNRCQPSSSRQLRDTTLL